MSLLKEKNCKILLNKNKSKPRSFFKKRLIPEFYFPNVIQKTKETKDSNFLVASGLYPPQIKCFDLDKLSLKFLRHLDYEILDFQILSSDWKKIVLLRNDRYIEFHSKSGCHYQLKLPSFCQDLTLDPESSILYIPSVTSEIFRLDLSEGKFLSPIKDNSSCFLSCSGISPVSSLLAFGDSLGVTRFWDPRVLKKPIGKTSGGYFTQKIKNAVSTIRFDENFSYTCYIGHKLGQTLIYDLRSFIPIISKSTEACLPVNSIRPNFPGNKILTSDSRSINLWNRKTGKTQKIIQAKSDINHVCNIKDSGFIFISTEAPFIETKFIENLGKAPNWFFGGVFKKENYSSEASKMNNIKYFSSDQTVVSKNFYKKSQKKKSNFKKLLPRTELE
mmetsp:Transcript_19112/g.38996  ORF Transcript_19112/g.38996 Transcript_19112/m.38996 type:complete len:388 (-) Transcript_19112:4102-5265(-)